MKYIISFFLTLSVLCTSLSAVEYGFISSHINSPNPNYLVLEEGDLLELFLSTKNNTTETLFIFSSQVDITEVTNGQWGQNINDYILHEFPIDGYTERKFCGPLVVVAQNPNILATYKLTRASEVEYKNVNIVALPSSTVGAGTHEIVVEASDDLQTWTPVHSSSIGGNKAFFRTRVVEAGE